MKRVHRPHGHPLSLAAPAVIALVVACAALPALPVAAAGRASCVRWVSPKGNDRWSGSSAKPWATLRHAARAVPDDRCTVWFRDGVYKGYNHVERRFSTWTTFRAVHPYEAVFVSSSIALEVGPSASHIVFQGLQFHQTGPTATGDLVYVSGADSGTPAPSNIVLRDNVIHDAWGDDLLKIRSAAHDITVQGNVFYDQANNEQHIDVNGVTDVRIVGNIFFNDFGGSGRKDTRTSKHFIVVKDSNGKADGFLGSRRIWIERNVFLRWQGDKEALIGIGNDGMPYLEARQVHVLNNLMIGNGADEAWTAFAVLGAADVSFVNNTVVGNLPSGDYAMDVAIKDANPRNRNIDFVNNIWDDPTGTMGTFSGGARADTKGLLLKRNLYWNGGKKIPGGDLLSPLRDDAQRVVHDPRLRKDQRGIVLPFWKGSRFRSGNRTIHQEFLRLVNRFGKIPTGSPAVGRALMTFAPRRDILGRLRGATADLGAYEAHG